MVCVSPVYRGVGAKGAVCDATVIFIQFFSKIFFDNFPAAKTAGEQKP